MATNKHIGSKFEDFLRDEGILDEVDARVQKRVLAEELRAAMRFRSLSEAALARAMKTSRTVVRSLLDPEAASVTLITLARAARAVGCELRVSFTAPRQKLRPVPRRTAAGRTTRTKKSGARPVAA